MKFEIELFWHQTLKAANHGHPLKFSFSREGKQSFIFITKSQFYRITTYVKNQTSKGKGECPLAPPPPMEAHAAIAVG
jgi:hypothetical protein